MNPVVHLTDVNSPYLAAVAGKHEKAKGKLERENLKKLAKSKDPKDKAKLRDAVSGAGAVLADMKLLENEDLKSGPTGDVCKAAFDVGTPVVLENVKSNQMTELTGSGLDTDAVMIESASNGRHFRFTLFGENSIEYKDKFDVESKTFEIKEEDPEKIKKLQKKLKNFPEELRNRGKAVKEGKLKSDATKPDDFRPDKAALKISEMIAARPFSKEMSKKYEIENRSMATLPNSTTVHSKSRIVYEYVCPKTTWSLPYHLYYGGDGIDFGITYIFDLVAGTGTSGVKGKYLNVKTSSQTLNPYPLMRDDAEYGRGYYTEYVKVNIGPTGSNIPATFQRVEWQPKNVNESSTIGTSTGWSITGQAISSQGLTVGYSSSNSYSRTIHDFGITDLSAGTQGIWEYKLNRTGDGTAYNSYTDLIDDGWFYDDLHELPTLAKANFPLEPDIVFKADANYCGTIPFKIGIHYRALYVYWGNDTGMGEGSDYLEEKKSKDWNIYPQIDFNAVAF